MALIPTDYLFNLKFQMKLICILTIRRNQSIYLSEETLLLCTPKNSCRPGQLLAAPILPSNSACFKKASSTPSKFNVSLTLQADPGQTCLPSSNSQVAENTPTLQNWTCKGTLKPPTAGHAIPPTAHQACMH